MTALAACFRSFSVSDRLAARWRGARCPGGALLLMWLNVCAATIILCPQYARAQNGGLDTGFGPSITSTNPGAEVNTLAVQSDGKIVIGGEFTQVNGVARTNLARLNADGTLDTAFNPVLNGYVYILVIQADGKIVLGGLFTEVDGETRNYLARLNADGSMDYTFDVSGTNGEVAYLAVQSDGKVVVGGKFSQVRGDASNNLARLNADGTIDASFYAAGGPNGEVYAVTLQANGGIVLSGLFTQVNGVPRQGIARLNADGTLDSSFNPSVTSASGSAYILAVQPDGRIVLGGQFTQVNGVARSNVARLNADGTLDTSFNASGAGTNGTVEALAVQPDGKIAVGGFFTQVNGATSNYVARLNAADGSLDASFNPSANAGVNVLAVQADSKIVLGGRFTAINNVAHQGAARLNGDAAPTLQFNTATITVTENAGSATLSVQRTAVSAGAVSVNYATADGSAKAGLDYQPVSGTLSWADGDAADKTITVPIIDRQLTTGSAAFVVDLSQPTGGAILTTPTEEAVTILETDAPPNNIQSVSLLSPPTDITLTQNVPVTLYADVEALANTLANVEFFVLDSAGNPTDLGGFTSERGQKTWQPPTVGNFTLEVVATDTQGHTESASNPVQIVAPDTQDAAPQTNLYGGLDGRTLALGDTVQVIAQAVDTDGNPLQNAQFYLDGVAIDSAAVSQSGTSSLKGGQPAAANGAAALYVAELRLAKISQLLTAVGINSRGVSAVSNGFLLYGKSNAGTPPSVAIANVANGASLPAGSAGQSVSVSASAGSQLLATVELYLDNQRLGQATSAPYTFILPALAVGPHVLSAVATDGTRLSRASTPVVVQAAHPAFFTGEVSVGNGVDYLSFPNSHYFGYYSYLSDAHYIYHFDLGYEYVFDAADEHAGVYLYDFKSGHFFYTSPVFPFPYLYDFTLNTVLYYYPDPSQAGHYNTNGYRFFYRFDTGKIFTQ